MKMLFALAFIVVKAAIAQDGKIVVHAFEAESCPISAEVKPLREEMASRLKGVRWELHQAPMFPNDDKKPAVKAALPYIWKYDLRNIPYYVVEYEGRVVYRGMQFSLPVSPDGKKQGDLYSYIGRMKERGEPIPNRLEEVLRELLQGKAPDKLIIVDERGCGLAEKFRKPPEAHK
jgi:hypothetical protein